MSRKIPKACKTALATYFDRECRYKVFHKIVNDTLSDRYMGRVNDVTQTAIDVVSNMLLSSVYDAMSNLLMWMQIDPGSLPEELRVAIVNKYAGSGRSIMHYIERELRHPGQFDSDDEDGFRGEINEWLMENMPDGWTENDGE